MQEPYDIFKDTNESAFALYRKVKHGPDITPMRRAVADSITDMQTARLLAAAPLLLESCERALTALNTAPRFRVPALDSGKEKMDSYKIASLLTRVIVLAKE